MEVAGRPMIEWSLDALRAAGIAEIVVALPPEGGGAGRAASACAAARRARESVRAALAARAAR